eukprot:COSAG05_NODE_528_length_8915_cov_26.504651_3_plen_487_part_00
MAGRSNTANRHSSEFRGVCWNKHVNKWQSQVRAGDRVLFLGYFDEEVECAKAYDRCVRKLRGAAARLNFPGGGAVPTVASKRLPASKIAKKRPGAAATYGRRARPRKPNSGSSTPLGSARVAKLTRSRGKKPAALATSIASEDGRKKMPWTHAEDLKLGRLMRAQGVGEWEKKAASFPNRTKAAVQGRWYHAAHQIEQLLKNRLAAAAAKKQRRQQREASGQSEEGVEVYEVEDILAKGVRADGVLLYRVRWRGYGPEQDTWEPAANLHSAKATIDEFERTAILERAAVAAPTMPRTTRKTVPMDTADNSNTEEERSRGEWTWTGRRWVWVHVDEHGRVINIPAAQEDEAADCTPDSIFTTDTGVKYYFPKRIVRRVESQGGTDPTGPGYVIHWVGAYANTLRFATESLVPLQIFSICSLATDTVTYIHACMASYVDYIRVMWLYGGLLYSDLLLAAHMQVSIARRISQSSQRRKWRRRRLSSRCC